MKAAASSVLIAVLVALAGCSNATPNESTLPSVILRSAGCVILRSGAQRCVSKGEGTRFEGRGTTSGGLTELYNLDYSSGTITVFSIQYNKATVTAQFTPGSSSGGAQGLAADAHGQIYTTLTESNSNPCAACVQIYSDAGKLVRQLDAPVLKGGSGPPSLTDVSVDARDNVYVSDYGQQAAYFFPHGRMTKHVHVVVQNSQNAASVLSQPDGANLLVSGGCGFASVRPFTRAGHGKYMQGNCFGIGTIALIGGAVDDQEEVMTPVDGVPGLVSVSSPTGGSSFQTPGRLASISGVAFNSDASIAYVANARKESVFAFARPASGWLSSTKPKLLQTYKGFKHLDIIAVPQ